MDTTILPPGTSVKITHRMFKVNDHIRLLGLNPRLKADRQRYASWLEAGNVLEPMALRGHRKDSSTGFCWGRKEEYIAKHKYGINLRFVASMLAGNEGDFGRCILGFVDALPAFTRYLVDLSGVSTAYVSVSTNDKGTKKILKVLPVKCGFSLKTV